MPGQVECSVSSERFGSTASADRAESRGVEAVAQLGASGSNGTTYSGVRSECSDCSFEGLIMNKD